MAVDIFLKVEGIEGESRDRDHKGEIEISSFSWGVTQTGSFGGGGGGGAGKASFQDIHFTSSVSKASPTLAKSCATGQHIKKATLVVRKSGGDVGGDEFYKVQMEDILVSSYQSGGASGDVLPTDQFSLNFAKIEYSVSGVVFDFDIARNTSG
jgi:type VI secretion system secreted protein Hcp